MRGIILAEGHAGRDLVDAARDHPAVTNAYRTMGKYCAALLFDGDMPAIRSIIGMVNRVEGVTDGETILELEFGIRQPSLENQGMFRALLLFTEHVGSGLEFERSFEESAKAVPGVVEAFSLLGSYDAVAYVKYDDMQELQHLVRSLETDSIRLVDVLLEQS